MDPLQYGNITTIDLVWSGGYFLNPISQLG